MKISEEIAKKELLKLHKIQKQNEKRIKELEKEQADLIKQLMERSKRYGKKQ